MNKEELDRTVTKVSWNLWKNKNLKSSIGNITSKYNKHNSKQRRLVWEEIIAVAAEVISEN